MNITKKRVALAVALLVLLVVSVGPLYGNTTPKSTPPIIPLTPDKGVQGVVIQQTTRNNAALLLMTNDTLARQPNCVDFSCSLRASHVDFIVRTPVTDGTVVVLMLERDRVKVCAIAAQYGLKLVTSFGGMKVACEQ